MWEKVAASVFGAGVRGLWREGLAGFAWRVQWGHCAGESVVCQQAVLSP